MHRKMNGHTVRDKILRPTINVAIQTKPLFHKRELAYNIEIIEIQ
jgi:hypothetical protein